MADLMGVSRGLNSVIAGYSHEEHFRRGLKGMCARQVKTTRKGEKGTGGRTGLSRG